MSLCRLRHPEMRAKKHFFAGGSHHLICVNAHPARPADSSGPNFSSARMATMNKPLIITALVLAMGTVTPSLAATQTSDNSLTMMGGSCPMMGMMGQGASGRGMMGGGMMSGNMMGTQQSNMGA